MAVEITRNLDLPAAPETVADVVVDLPRWPKWFAMYKGWVGDPPSRLEKGTRFKHKVRILGVPGEVDWTVTDLDYPSHFHMKGKGTSRTGVELDFRIAPGGEGTRVAMSARLTGLALKPFESMVKPWLEVRVDRTADAIRERLAE